MLLKKNQPLVNKRKSKLRQVDITDFVAPAKEYLKLEKQLRAEQALANHHRNKAYAISNKMQDISYKRLGFIGHQVVDEMRKENAKHSKRPNGN